MAIEIGLAEPRQIREVLNLLVSGVTSDVSSMEEIAGSWWRRFLFLRWFGPRFLGKQMDTFVATKGDSIIGFVIVQYDGDAAGTFDWAFLEPLDVGDNREEFADLIDTALDHVEEQGIHPTSTLVLRQPLLRKSRKFWTSSDLAGPITRTFSW